jgi:hypothetical protein
MKRNDEIVVPDNLKVHRHQWLVFFFFLRINQ